MDLLTEAREQNKCLRLQVEALRQRLVDAEGDIKALRTNNNHNNRVSIDHQDAQLAPAMHQREEMIEQLEKLNLKASIKDEMLNINQQ